MLHMPVLQTPAALTSL